MIRKRRNTYLQARLNGDNGGSATSTTTTTMEEACATVDRWWSNEGTSVFCNETTTKEHWCSSMTLALENGREKNGHCSRKDDEQCCDFFLTLRRIIVSIDFKLRHKNISVSVTCNPRHIPLEKKSNIPQL